MGKKKIERVIHTLAFFGSKFGDFFGNFVGIFFWEHTPGLSTRQRAGTLERVVKYDEGFTKAWNCLASKLQ